MMPDRPVAGQDAPAYSADASSGTPQVREAIARVIYDYWLSVTETGDWPERWEDEDTETQQGFLGEADKVLAVIGAAGWNIGDAGAAEKVGP